MRRASVHTTRRFYHAGGSEWAIAYHEQGLRSILDSIEEMYSTYVYLRNEDLTIFALEFLSCTLPVWLTPDFGTELEEHAMRIAQWLVGRFLGMTSRLGAHDWPSSASSTSISTTTAASRSGPKSPMIRIRYPGLFRPARGGPLELIADGLVDRDARTRIRAATSTAGLYYLEALTPAHHFSFYIATMQKQPRQPVLWDSFLTDMLWKLNCLVTSSAVRHATLYHLYEIPLEGAALIGISSAVSKLLLRDSV